MYRRHFVPPESLLMKLVDFVPIVGTAKNTYECLDAIMHCEGREAFQKGTSAVIGGALDLMTFGGSSAILSASKYGIKYAVKIVALKGAKASVGEITANTCGRLGGRVLLEFLEFRNNRSRRDSSPTRGDFNSHRNHIPYETLADIRHQHQTSREQDDDDDDDRRNNRRERSPKRGDHVINNNVLNVYRDIVRSFVSEVMGDDLDNMIESGRLSRNSNVVRLINQPIPEDVAERIRNQMSVHLDVDGPYTDTNSHTYGINIPQIRTTVRLYMADLYHGFLTRDHSRVPGAERRVRDAVESFIAGNYFVDEQALKMWLSKRGNTKEDFEKIRQEVINMFRKLKYDPGDGNDGMVITWVNELFEARLR